MEVKIPIIMTLSGFDQGGHIPQNTPKCSSKSPKELRDFLESQNVKIELHKSEATICYGIKDKIQTCPLDMIEENRKYIIGYTLKGIQENNSIEIELKDIFEISGGRGFDGESVNWKKGIEGYIKRGFFPSKYSEEIKDLLELEKNLRDLYLIKFRS